MPSEDVLPTHARRTLKPERTRSSTHTRKRNGMKDGMITLQLITITLLSSSSHVGFGHVAID